MSVAQALGMQGRAGAAFRWGAAAAAVLALHGAAVMLLLNRTVAPPVLPAAPEAVMMDLSPPMPPLQSATVAPPTPAAVPLAPEPPPPEPPSPEPQVPQPPQASPMPPVPSEAALPEPPPPPPLPPRVQPRLRPPPRPRPVERAPPPPQEMARPTEPAAAPAAPTAPAAQPAARPPAALSNALPNWRNLLLGRLQAAKRYPDAARSRGEQGVATVRFTMDRGGRVLDAALLRSSGSPLLDEEAVALVRRAQPLPPLPEEIAGPSVTLTVPISFALR